MLTTQDRILLRDKIFSDLYNNHLIITFKGSCSRLTSYKEFYEYINSNNQLQKDYNEYISQFESKDEAEYCLIHKDDPENHKCAVCGKLCGFHNKTYGYRKTCKSNDCLKALSRSDKAKKKAIQTNQKRRGVDYPTQSLEVKEKIRKKSIETFGCEYPTQSKIVKEKTRKTCNKKYGYDHPMQSAQVRAKTEDTCIKKFGCKTPLQCEETKEKIKQSTLEHFGVENASQSEEIKEKKKKTSIKRFGRESFKQQHIKNYEIWIDDEKFKQFVVDKFNNKKSFLLLKDICNFFNVKITTAKKRIQKVDLLDCFYIQRSNLEMKFEKLLINNNINYEQFNRKILYKKETKSYQEIDFYCEAFNIGFEINDISTHNSLDTNENAHYYKNPLYHQQKSLMAISHNIRLIHVWEWELLDNKYWKKLSRWILNLLNCSKIKIKFKECQLKLVSVNEAENFVNEYSLQKYEKSDIRIGLYYKNELIQLMTFTHNINDLQLINLCTKYNFNITEGYKNILNYCANSYHIKSIIAICDLDKENYALYKELGFKIVKINEPNLIWCNKEMDVINELLRENKGGYVPIYKCGTATFQYII